MNNWRELSSEEINKMTRKELLDSGIDKEMLELVIELNKIGLKTMFSCAGHGESTTASGWGYITLDLNSIEEVIVDINQKKLDIYWSR